MAPPAKNPALHFVPPIVLISVFLLEIRPWLLAQASFRTPNPILVVASAAVWGLTLWWALHHLAFQIASLVVPVGRETPPHPKLPVRILILLPTRDDFQPDCAKSCAGQDYPNDCFRVVVCDDGDTDEGRRTVDRYCSELGVAVLRRDGRHGFKAGNLNWGFAACAGEGWDWIAIVDADQYLRPDWLAELAPVLAAQPPDVAFVQAGREPLVDGLRTPFQRAMEREMVQFFERDMAARPNFGFVPFLGHGGAIRADVWKRIGGMPAVVSEDFAFSCEIWKHGLRGAREDQIRSNEGYPLDFAAFVVRLGKFAAGAGELWFRKLPEYLRSPVNLTERWDAVMLFATYFLMPLLAINLIASAYVCHVLWNSDRTVLSSNLSYLFLAMFGLSSAVATSIHRNPLDVVRHWFWATAIYSSALPVAAGRFLAALVRRPAFRRTPKAIGHRERFGSTRWFVAFGGTIQCALAFHWWSPFASILLSFGFAQLLFPGFLYLHESNSARGRLARLAVYLPGILALAGLIGMWIWSTE